MNSFVDFYEKLIVAISKCQISQSDKICTFALYHDAANGILAAAFDSLDNSLYRAKLNEKVVTKEFTARKKIQDNEIRALAYLNWEDSTIHEYNTAFSEMKYHLLDCYYQDIVDNISTLSESIHLHVYNIFEKLIDKNIFNSILMSSPFRLGICTYESSNMKIARILNWPEHKGPRI